MTSPARRKILYGQIPVVERQLSEAEGAEKPKDQLSPEVVDAEQIAAVVARWTGVPVEKMLEGERDSCCAWRTCCACAWSGRRRRCSRLRRGAQSSRRVEGPRAAHRLIPVPRSDGRRQDELTKALAEFLFDDEAAVTRLDMSEYMEKHSTSRMIGAPPGYVGYDEGGALTEAVRRRPYQVVLFDEVEKAHPDVFNVLLQVLVDGRLTDGQGRTVDFRNTLIVMTSNLGSEALANLPDDADVETARPLVMDSVRRHFRPEFLNRIDEIILFQRLGRAQMDSIVSIQLQRVEKLLADRRMAISLDPGALHWLGEKGYDPVYGARPLKRVIQKELVDPIARKLLAGDLADGAVIDVHAATASWRSGGRRSSKRPAAWNAGASAAFPRVRPAELSTSWRAEAEMRHRPCFRRAPLAGASRESAGPAAVARTTTPRCSWTSTAHWRRSSGVRTRFGRHRG